MIFRLLLKFCDALFTALIASVCQLLLSATFAFRKQVFHLVLAILLFCTPKQVNILLLQHANLWTGVGSDEKNLMRMLKFSFSGTQRNFFVGGFHNLFKIEFCAIWVFFGFGQSTAGIFYAL